MDKEHLGVAPSAPGSSLQPAVSAAIPNADYDSLASHIIKWLRAKLGNGRYDRARHSAWIEHDWCGDTEGGFYSEYEIDYDKLLTDIDAWIAAKFSAPGNEAARQAGKEG